MIPFGGEALFPARVIRRGKRAADVAGNDSAVFPQFCERPFEIPGLKPSILPICHRVTRPKTIEIDRNVNISVAEIGNEHFEIISPILAQDRTATLSIFDGAIISPRVNFEPAFALGATIGENIVRPPALEISAAPNRDVLDVHELERAIDPASTAPLWRTHVPVRVIIK